MYVRWKRRQLKRLPEPVYEDDVRGDFNHVRCGSTGYKMYVRNCGWHQHVRKQGVRPDEVRLQPAPVEFALDAVLVESYRADGKPRQRYIGHLATIREDDTHSALLWPQYLFWDTVEKQLTMLGVSDDARTGIIATLAKRVPELTPEAREAQRLRMRAHDRGRTTGLL